jgi:hypothetical protein
MEIRVNIPEELATQARARGVPVKDYIEELLAKQVIYVVMTKRVEDPLSRIRTTRKAGRREHLSRFGRGLTRWRSFSDKIPPLPEAISREWIYQDHE